MSAFSPLRAQIDLSHQRICQAPCAHRTRSANITQRKAAANAPALKHRLQKSRCRVDSEATFRVQLIWSEEENPVRSSGYFDVSTKLLGLKLKRLRLHFGTLHIDFHGLRCLRVESGISFQRRRGVLSLQKWRRRYFVLHAPPAVDRLPGSSNCVLDYFKDSTKAKKKGSIDLDQCEEITAALDSAHYQVETTVGPAEKLGN